MVSGIVEQGKTRLGHNLNFVGVSLDIANNLARLGTNAQNKNLVVSSFLWFYIGRVSQNIVEQEIRELLSAKLAEEGVKTESFPLARSLLKSLSLSAKSIDYDRIIDYSNGRVDSETLTRAFNLTEQKSKEMSLPPNEVGFATLTLAQKLGEAWAEASEILSGLVKESMEKLSTDLKESDDAKAMTALLATTEETLYNLHMKAYAKRI